MKLEEAYALAEVLTEERNGGKIMVLKFNLVKMKERIFHIFI